MQTFINCKVTLNVSGVTAPIIRSTKNCNRYLWYRSQFWYGYFLPTWPDPKKKKKKKKTVLTTIEGNSITTVVIKI